MIKLLPLACLAILSSCASSRFMAQPPAPEESAAFAEGLGSGGEWDFSLGLSANKSFVDSQWKPTTDLLGLGLEVDGILRRPGESGTGFEAGYRHGESDDVSFAISHGGDENTWREVFAGIRYEQPAWIGRLLLSGGLSRMSVSAEQDTIFGTSFVDLDSIGLYVRGGMIIPLASQLSGVLSARYRDGQDGETSNRSLSLRQASIEFTLSWKF